MTAVCTKRKQSLYFSNEMLAEIEGEALRLDRSMSWVVQRAWRIARNSIQKLPSSEIPGCLSSHADVK